MDKKIKITPLINKYDQLKKEINKKNEYIDDYKNKSKCSNNIIYFSKKGLLVAFFTFLFSNILFFKIFSFIIDANNKLEHADKFFIMLITSFSFLVFCTIFNLSMDNDKIKKKLKILSFDIHLISICLIPFIFSFFSLILVSFMCPEIRRKKKITSYTEFEDDRLKLKSLNDDISKLNMAVNDVENEIKNCTKSLQYLNINYCQHDKLRDKIFNLLQKEYLNKNIIEHHIKFKNIKNIINS
jgi:chromate transport protein ChrA